MPSCALLPQPAVLTRSVALTSVQPSAGIDDQLAAPPAMLHHVPAVVGDGELHLLRRLCGDGPAGGGGAHGVLGEVVGEERAPGVGLGDGVGLGVLVGVLVGVMVGELVAVGVGVEEPLTKL